MTAADGEILFWELIQFLSRGREHRADEKTNWSEQGEREESTKR